MEYYATLKLREDWGKKPCDHPQLERLYYVGAFLISYACKQCGKEFTIAEKLEMDENRRKVV